MHNNEGSETFIASFKTAPSELILDFDATDDRVHGHQEGRHYLLLGIMRGPVAGQLSAPQQPGGGETRGGYFGVTGQAVSPAVAWGEDSVPRRFGLLPAQAHDMV